jgi:cysteine desulfurase
MIYLDNAATTKMHPKVYEAMVPFLLDEYGNPEAKYYDLAIHAKHAVDRSREIIADYFHCKESEIIFMSGASEGNNFIIKGIADAYSHKGKHIITTQIEHPSVLETCKYLETKGYDVTYLSVDEKGLINLQELKESINENTILITIMWVNNEIGTIMPIDQVGEIAKKHKVFFHTDATQAIGKLNIDFSRYMNIDAVTISGHKIHGPKGIGATMLRHDHLGIPLKIPSLIHGGSQEYGYRAGTHPVYSIVGLGKALDLIVNRDSEYFEKMVSYRNRIITSLERKFSDLIVFNTDFDTSVPSIMNFQVKGINNQIFIKTVSKYIALSNGSACSIDKPSHVLKAIGKTKEEINQSVRLSFAYDLNILETIKVLEDL